jgi:phosphopantetheinyl transferase
MNWLEEDPGLVLHDRPDAPIGDLSGLHGWFCDLDELDSGASALSVLSATERSRAMRLKRDQDRRRYVARHAFVRRVLGAVLHRPPETLVFRTGRCGKPYLSGGFEPERKGVRGLNFSLSHSESILALAVTSGREMGIDVEVVRPVSSSLAIAAIPVGLETPEPLPSRPAGERDYTFYRLWTRNEAVAKMHGRGIDCRHSHEPPTIARWILRSFTFDRGGQQIVGAFAIEDLLGLPFYSFRASLAFGRSSQLSHLRQRVARIAFRA